MTRWGSQEQDELLGLFTQGDLSFAQRDLAELEAAALRAQSVQMRDIFAQRASGGALNAVDIQQKVLNESSRSEPNAGDPSTGKSGTGQSNTARLNTEQPSTGKPLDLRSLEPRALAGLARVAALQNFEENDTSFAITTLNQVLPKLPRAEQSQTLKLLAELLYEEKRFAELDVLVAEHPRINNFFHAYIGVDAKNPHVRRGADERAWLEGFNRPFVERGLLPVTLDEGHEVPFNRLTVNAGNAPQKNQKPEDDADPSSPMVTVILTSYRPARADILNSARSILNQTWHHLELLIVDDASGPEHREVLAELETLDERVRVIRLDTNGGTYRARNIGMAQARGEFITGQDADDWSHPQRIQAQVAHLINNPHCPGNQVNTINMDEDLSRIRHGYHPFFLSPPSLMLRADIMRELGGYLPARKGADNELRDRAGAFTGHRVEHIAAPLVLMRILPSSLSRADFRPGWQHPARLAFWSAYRNWHRYADPQDLCLSSTDRLPLQIPARLANRPEQPSVLDVVFAVDLSHFSRQAATTLHEIAALRDAGLKIGVMHLEDPGLHAAEPGRFTRAFQQVINSGEITQVLADEDFHQIKLVLVRNPRLLQFLPAGETAFTPDVLAVVENSAVAGSVDDENVGKRREALGNQTEAFFGRKPVWLTSAQYPTFYDTRTGQVPRRGPRNTRPVITRTADILPHYWPQDAELRELLYPSDGSADVRLIGDAAAAASALDLPRLPAEWMVYDPAEISMPAALGSADFFIHFTEADTHSSPGEQAAQAVPEPHDAQLGAGSAADRLPQQDLAILQALAAGCIVILPQRYEPEPGQDGLYGDAALYAEPTQVPELVEKFWHDGELYRQQSQRAASFTPRFNRQDYLALINWLESTGEKEGL